MVSSAGKLFRPELTEEILHAAVKNWQPIRGDLVASASGVVTVATASSAVWLSDPRRTIWEAGLQAQVRHHMICR
jgi:hypothetical protein